MRRIGSGFRFCWSPFSLTGKKIQACRQNSDLQAANSEELCVIVKRKNQGCTRTIFLGFYLQHCELQMVTTDRKLKLSDIFDSTWGWTEMEMSRSALVPQLFPLFPPGSFKLLFLLSATCSYGNLCIMVPLVCTCVRSGDRNHHMLPSSRIIQ